MSTLGQLIDRLLGQGARQLGGAVPLSVPPNTFVWFDLGEIELLANALTRNYQVAWQMRLYVNDYTPAPTDNGTTPPITEASYPGYAAVNTGAWSTPSTVSAVAQSNGTACTFTSSGSIVTPQTVYGWFMNLQAGSTAILGACRFNSPVTINAPGQTITITPSVTLRSLGS